MIWLWNLFDGVYNFNWDIINLFTKSAEVLFLVLWIDLFIKFYYTIGIHMIFFVSHFYDVSFWYSMNNVLGYFFSPCCYTSRSLLKWLRLNTLSGLIGYKDICPTQCIFKEADNFMFLLIWKWSDEKPRQNSLCASYCHGEGHFCLNIWVTLIITKQQLYLYKLLKKRYIIYFTE